MIYDISIGLNYYVNSTKVVSIVSVLIMKMAPLLNKSSGMCLRILWEALTQMSEILHATVVI